MSQNITLLSASYSDVPSVLLPKTGGGTAQFDDTTIASNAASASDIANGKLAWANGEMITGTASGSSSNDFIVTLAYNNSTQMWEPDCTIYEFQNAYDGGKRIVLYGDGCAPAGWYYDDDYMFMYAIYFGGNNEMNLQEYWWTLEGIEAVGSNTFIFPNFESVTHTYTPTTSQQTDTITYNSSLGYNGLQQVAVTVNAMPTGTAGTPTATKGSVNNHSISVTPSVTNTTGYITGSTKTGTAVTVSASELVSGSETKTANGTYDVTNLAELVVNVGSIKTKTGTFTGNGTRTIDVSCDWEPDLIYVTSNPGTTASSGTVAFIIVRGMMTATRYRNNSTTNSHYAIPDIANMNSSGSSYSWRATYANSKVTLYCYSSNARGLLTNGRTYSYTFMKWT